MKIKVCLIAYAVLLSASAAVFADDVSDEYRKLMQPAAAANMALQKVADTDLAASAKAASDMQAAFAKVEEFWTKRGTADAIGFAKSVQAVAKEVHDAAAAGDQAATSAAAKKVAANCASCHMAHRTRLPDGTFQLKP